MPADVLAFMSQHGIELRPRPFSPTLRQDDPRAKKAHVIGATHDTPFSRFARMVPIANRISREIAPRK